MKIFANFDIYFSLLESSKIKMNSTTNNTIGMSFKIEFFCAMKRTMSFEIEWLRWENDTKVNLNTLEVKATKTISFILYTFKFLPSCYERFFLKAKVQ